MRNMSKTNRGLMERLQCKGIVKDCKMNDTSLSWIEVYLNDSTTRHIKTCQLGSSEIKDILTALLSGQDVNIDDASAAESMQMQTDEQGNDAHDTLNQYRIYAKSKHLLRTTSSDEIEKTHESYVMGLIYKYGNDFKSFKDDITSYFFINRMIYNYDFELANNKDIVYYDNDYILTRYGYDRIKKAIEKYHELVK